MLKTHKIALDPNNVQATVFAQHCGYARVAYNHALADFKDGLDNNEWRSISALNKRFNATKRETYQWCDELSKYQQTKQFGRILIMQLPGGGRG